MQKRLTWMVLLLIALAAIWGCSSDDDGPVTPTETAWDVLVEAAKAYIDDSADCPGVITAQSLYDNLDDYTVIDIRSEADYVAGHIPGAYHSTLGTLVGDLAAKSLPTDKPYVLACYSGQSAGHAKIAMELLGYEDVKTLGYGMASWCDATRGSWANYTADLLTDPETANNNGDLVAGAFPTALAGMNKDTVIADRVAAMLAAGFKGKSYTEIQDNLDDYFIVNYFAQADYEGTGAAGVPGHIPGSYQFTPYASLGFDEMLNTLPTDKPIIVYCWTGQHSSQVTAYLNLLGYEAYSLKYGSNALFHSALTAHAWDTAAQPDFELESGYAPTPAFAAMAAAGAEYINDSGDCPGVIGAQTLYDNLDDYIVVDIRAESAFLAGHIPGAYHSSLATIVDDAGTVFPTDLPIVIACYSGQTAGHAKVALELMGYEDVKTLGFGMSSWAASTRGSWDNAVANLLTGPETTNNNGDLVAGSYPTLAGYDAASVVATRVGEMLTAGFKGKSYTEIQDNLDDYFIVNYFGQADYEGTGTAGVPGHIPGAFQFTPYASLGMGELLPMLPTDMPIIVYCWTGQHSSQVTAYLNLLGYEAYSLKFGSNALFHDALTANAWNSNSYHDFEVEMGSRISEQLETLGSAIGAYISDSGDCPGTITAQALYDNLTDYTVIDIRSLADYNNGHIDGAYHSSLATLLDDVGTTIPTDLPMVLACYSGQSAGHAKIALELMGYEDVKSLGFGMASWAASTRAAWDNNIGNALTVAETTGNNGELVAGAYPTLDTYDSATIIETRVAEMLAAGFQGVSYATIQDNLDDYFIINYFGLADYEGTGGAGVPGHIPGAYQFTPYTSMDPESMLAYLPTDKTIVVYCWTGQHSSQITAALNMVGYTAKSLTYGSNALFHDELTAHVWNAAQYHDFPLVATPIQ